MLSHEKEQRFIYSHIKLFLGCPFHLLGIRRIGKFGSVIHHLEGSLVAIFAQGFAYRSLRHPNLIYALVKLHYLAHEIIYQSLAGNYSFKIVTIFGMKGCHQWNTHPASRLQGKITRRERTMRM